MYQSSKAAILTTPEIFPMNGGSGFGFSTKEVNTMARNEYMDTFGYYQNTFGLYSYMRLSKLNEFILHTIKGTPLMWQPHNSCTIDPTGSLRMGQTTFTPDKATIYEKFCYDELFDSCYEHFLEWFTNGTMDMSEDGMRMFGLLVDELMANAAMGTRMGLTTGRLYDVAAVSPSSDTPAEIFNLFTRTHGTVKGWLKIVVDSATAGNTWLNQTSVVTSLDFVAGVYTGANNTLDFVELYDAILGNSQKQLKKLVQQAGLITSGGRRFRPLVVISNSYFQALTNYYNGYAAQAATNLVRITREVVNVAGNGMPGYQYYIDNIPVLLIDDIQGYDEFVNKNTHYFGIVASGNIQMGLSFSDIPQNVEQGIAMMVARNNDITRDDYGTYAFRSFALMAAAIADVNYMAGVVTSTDDV